jgi:hypothetical protein
MKNSNIAESVFNINLYYTRKQNKTKELFFQCLDDGRDVDYFKAELEKIWGEIDTQYLEEQIIEYMAFIHEINTGKKLDKNDVSLIETASLGAILLTNKLFKKIKSKEYKTRIESYGYETNKTEYLKKLVSKYTSNTKRYKNGRFVSPSTYNSMVYNTALTRNGWTQTINDASDLGIGYFIIRYHPFSCEHCMEHQNRLMSLDECVDLLGYADEAQGDILHPNCKCELQMVRNNKELDEYQDPYANLSYEEKVEISEIRQQVNSLTLERERLRTDLKLYKKLDDQENIDKTKAKISKINTAVKGLQEALPTDLRKQVVAINR